jgi:phosphatidylserine decarboxylase
VGGKPLPLLVWDRQAGKLVEEFMDDHPATYDSRPRRSLTQWLESRRLYDWLIAAYQDTGWSAREIEPFISKHKIDMSEFKPVKYRSFAEFFDREFRPGLRRFPGEPDQMGAFSEARYFAWAKLEPGQKFPVKGHSLSAARILGSESAQNPTWAALSSSRALRLLTTTTIIIPMTALQPTVLRLAVRSGR